MHGFFVTTNKSVCMNTKVYLIHQCDSRHNYMNNNIITTFTSRTDALQAHNDDNRCVNCHQNYKNV